MAISRGGAGKQVENDADSRAANRMHLRRVVPKGSTGRLRLNSGVSTACIRKRRRSHIAISQPSPGNRPSERQEDSRLRATTARHRCWGGRSVLSRRGSEKASRSGPNAPEHLFHERHRHRKHAHQQQAEERRKRHSRPSAGVRTVDRACHRKRGRSVPDRLKGRHPRHCSCGSVRLIGTPLQDIARTGKLVAAVPDPQNAP